MRSFHLLRSFSPLLLACVPMLAPTGCGHSSSPASSGNTGAVARFDVTTNPTPNFLDVPFPSDVYLQGGQVTTIPGVDAIVKDNSNFITHELREDGRLLAHRARDVLRRRLLGAPRRQRRCRLRAARSHHVPDRRDRVRRGHELDVPHRPRRDRSVEGARHLPRDVPPGLPEHVEPDARRHRARARRRPRRGAPLRRRPHEPREDHRRPRDPAERRLQEGAERRPERAGPLHGRLPDGDDRPRAAPSAPTARRSWRSRPTRRTR